MDLNLHNYDIYPKVFPVGKEVSITIKPLGKHVRFTGDYKLVVQRLDSGSAHFTFSSWNHTDFNLKPHEDGCLHFTYTAQAECEHFVRIYKDDKRIAQLSVYALNEDLSQRLPFRGDLHMHTFRSDGQQDPAIVCAEYRRQGYDFIVITDHRRYYPSLEAMNAYKGVKTALNILPGEEVHLPGTDVHIVNAGGQFSVNGLLEGSINAAETEGALDGRRLDKSITPPDVISKEEYNRQIDAIADTLTDCPSDVDSRWYAVCSWAFDKIRQADGCCIFAHPYWIADMWHVPEALTRYIMKKHPFDAFEVLGGENYYQQNGFQTALYYDEYKEGRVHAIVGSTDSHNCLPEHNRNAAICSTIVFARENERSELVQSIRDRYSVAVDTISKEYRLVGEHRLQKYACFLMENFYPLHDRQAALDGELMRRYYVGDADAASLELISEHAEAMFKKYFVR